VAQVKTPRAGSPTLDEVARVAGVSRATASRAINGGQRVSPRAQSAVDTAVRSLGYVPNPAARSLVTRRTDSIAVVVPEPDDRVFSDPFFAGTLRGVNRVLGERDIQLVLLLARPGASTAPWSSPTTATTGSPSTSPTSACPASSAVVPGPGATGWPTSTSTTWRVSARRPRP
jgi:hypothetical protein